MKQLPILVLKGCFCGENLPYRLHDHVGRPGFDRDKVCLSSSVLEAINLHEGLEMEWVRAGIRDEAGLTLCSVAIPASAEVESGWRWELAGAKAMRIRPELVCS